MCVYIFTYVCVNGQWWEDMHAYMHAFVNRKVGISVNLCGMVVVVNGMVEQ